MQKKVTVIIPIFAVICLLGVIYMKYYEYEYADAFYYLTIIIFICMIIGMFWHIPTAKIPKEEEKKIIPLIPIAEEEKKIEKKVISYPPTDVSGAIHVNTLVSITDILTLNLRTYIGRSCLLCENKDICCEKYENKLSSDDFLGNIECMEENVGTT